MADWTGRVTSLMAEGSSSPAAEAAGAQSSSQSRGTFTPVGRIRSQTLTMQLRIPRDHEIPLSLVSFGKPAGGPRGSCIIKAVVAMQGPVTYQLCKHSGRVDSRLKQWNRRTNLYTETRITLQARETLKDTSGGLCGCL
jgi:hypothetical protein